MRQHPHILNAASNLLGICVVIIGSVRLTNTDTLVDETTVLAMMSFLASILLAYAALRRDTVADWIHTAADYAFMVGVVALSLAALLFASGL